MVLGRRNILSKRDAIQACILTMLAACLLARQPLAIDRCPVEGDYRFTALGGSGLWV